MPSGNACALSCQASTAVKCRCLLRGGCWHALLHAVHLPVLHACTGWQFNVSPPHAASTTRLHTHNTNHRFNTFYNARIAESAADATGVTWPAERITRLWQFFFKVCVCLSLLE